MKGFLTQWNAHALLTYKGVKDFYAAYIPVRPKIYKGFMAGW